MEISKNLPKRDLKNINYKSLFDNQLFEILLAIATETTTNPLPEAVVREIFCKKVLKYVGKFKRHDLYWILFFNKISYQNPETSLKRDSDRGVFLCILLNF